MDERMILLGNYEHDIQNFHKICSTLHTITKMDIRLIDNNGNPILQLLKNDLPVVFQNINVEYAAIHTLLKTNSSTSYFYYTNSYSLEFIATGIWKNQDYQGFLLLGPFLSNIPSIELVSDVIYKNNMSISQRKHLQEFYHSLHVVSSNESNSMGDLLVNMCGHPYIDAELVTSEMNHPTLNKEQLKKDIAESKTIIELRYQHEKKIMKAIERGSKEQIEKISKEMNSMFHIPDRIPESPIRSSKNLMLVMNTLCRISAEKGGLHPIYIHNISEKFSILIERTSNLPHLKKLAFVMIQEYCEAVQLFSTSQYSPIVKKAVEYIDFYLDQPVTLNELAASIHVNPSYLSRKFKQETNMNIIDYIHQKRIEEAKIYIQRGNISITDIAYMVGFNDLNYFSKVFKKITSFTPTQYGKMLYEQSSMHDEQHI